MKYALLSLSDKEGILSFADGLIKAGYKLLATGGTARHLQDNNLPVTLIEELIEFPEILNGRVKTLHPRVLGGILADRDNPQHLEELEHLMIKLIDLVVVNLYPFQKLFSESKENKNAITHSEMIENIDIGGVTLLRAAAKNYQHVAIVTEKEDYQPLLDELNEMGQIRLETRFILAQKAFATTSAYDRYIYQYLQQYDQESTSELFLFPNWHKTELRYGENPHQKALFFSPGTDGLIEQLHGKQLSYNNYLDINAALKLIYRFEKPTVAIFKHTNPCGVASADDLVTAYQNAFATDPLSPFGGIVIINKPLDMETAQAIDKIFTEIIITPGFSDEVFQFLLKKKDRRLIRYNPSRLDQWSETPVFISCLDGVLCQDIDIKSDDEANWKIMTDRLPTQEEYKSLRFCWNVVTALKSNAICLGKNEQTLGLGMGQTSRIDSAEIAINRAQKYNLSLEGSVCASDGFFPFPDAIELLAARGITAVIQPGGSRGDEEVINACKEKGISMIFTGRRHFAH